MSRLFSIAVEDVVGWFVDLTNEHGPDIASTGHLKVQKEAKEFADEPSLEEAADVIICVIGACWHRGWSMGDLATAIIMKMAINRQRTWSKLEDGTYQHD